MAIRVEYMEGPAFFACALVNGDESGLSSSESDELDSFMDEIKREHGESAYVVDVDRDESGNMVSECGDYMGVQWVELTRYVIHVNEDEKESINA